MSKWFFAIDKGGTFTDIIGIDPNNKIHTAKILSQSPSYADSVVEGIRQVLGLGWVHGARGRRACVT